MHACCYGVNRQVLQEPQYMLGQAKNWLSLVPFWKFGLIYSDAFFSESFAELHLFFRRKRRELNAQEMGYHSICLSVI